MRAAGQDLTLDASEGVVSDASWVVSADGDPLIEAWIGPFDEEHPSRTSYPEVVWEARIGEADSAAQAMTVAAGLAHATEGWVHDPQASHEEPQIRARLPNPAPGSCHPEHAVYDPDYALALARAFAVLGL